jgi:hypothetical protein
MKRKSNSKGSRSSSGKASRHRVLSRVNLASPKSVATSLESLDLDSLPTVDSIRADLTALQADLRKERQRNRERLDSVLRRHRALLQSELVESVRCKRALENLEATIQKIVVEEEEYQSDESIDHDASEKELLLTLSVGGGVAGGVSGMEIVKIDCEQCDGCASSKATSPTCSLSGTSHTGSSCCESDSSDGVNSDPSCSRSSMLRSCSSLSSETQDRVLSLERTMEMKRAKCEALLHQQVDKLALDAQESGQQLSDSFCLKHGLYGTYFSMRMKEVSKTTFSYFPLTHAIVWGHSSPTFSFVSHLF